MKYLSAKIIQMSENSRCRLKFFTKSKSSTKYSFLYIKFRYCERATKFEKISRLFFKLPMIVKTKWCIFFQIVLALSEYLNFSIKWQVLHWKQIESTQRLGSNLWSQSFNQIKSLLLECLTCAQFNQINCKALSNFQNANL